MTETTSDWYDQHDDKVPAVIQNSRWSCLDCPEPSGEPWESVTDYCHPAHQHHLATGHRVNGSVETRYRAVPLPFPEPAVAAPGRTAAASTYGTEWDPRPDYGRTAPDGAS